MAFNHFDHGIELPQLTRQTTESGRKYFTPTGDAFPSVTTVLGILGKRELMEWRKRVGDEEANRISRQAATRGTAVHKLCEDYIDNKEDYSKKHMPANIHMFNTMKPLLDEKINNIWFQEAFLYSTELRTAGQVDCIAEFEGELSVIDFKTSRRQKSASNIQNYFMQVSFYAKAFEERTGTPIRKGVVLIGVDDSEPQTFVIDTEEYLEHFKAVRETYSELYEKNTLHNN
jgi:genome maintenance exonuclease 1